MERSKFELSEVNQRRLDSLVFRIGQHVLSAVNAEPTKDRIAAVALFSPQEDLGFGYFPDRITCLPAGVRDAALATGVEEYRKLMWDPDTWPIECFPSDGVETSEDGRPWDALAKHPAQDPVEWREPTEWVHQSVCRYIAYHPPRSADSLFICFIHEAESMVDGLIDETLLYALPLSTYNSLRELGALPVSRDS